MCDTNQIIMEFVSNNWLGIGVALVILQAIAREFRYNWLGKVYRILAGAMKFIRPSTNLESPTQIQK